MLRWLDAFIASRLGSYWNHTLGMRPSGVGVPAIVERAQWPKERLGALTVPKGESAVIWRSPLLLFPILWALAGALFGAGFAATLSIGWGLILLGVILAGVAAWQSQGRGLWAALIGFGLAPAAILILDVLTAPPPCSGQPVSVAGGGFNCGYTPLSYTYMAIGFGVIALIGALIPLAPRITRALRSGNAHPNDVI